MIIMLINMRNLRKIWTKDNEIELVQTYLIDLFT